MYSYPADLGFGLIKSFSTYGAQQSCPMVEQLSCFFSWVSLSENIHNLHYIFHHRL